jgi:hypothetical protein
MKPYNPAIWTGPTKGSSASVVDVPAHRPLATVALDRIRLDLAALSDIPGFSPLMFILLCWLAIGLLLVTAQTGFNMPSDSTGAGMALRLLGANIDYLAKYTIGAPLRLLEAFWHWGFGIPTRIAHPLAIASLILLLAWYARRILREFRQQLL